MTSDPEAALDDIERIGCCDENDLHPGQHSNWCPAVRLRAWVQTARDALARHHDWSKGGVRGYEAGKAELYDLTVKVLGADTEKEKPTTHWPDETT